MLKRTRWNSLALFLIVNLQGVLKTFLGLTLLTPGLVYNLIERNKTLLELVQLGHLPAAHSNSQKNWSSQLIDS